jgi:hypothetical protein
MAIYRQTCNMGNSFMKKSVLEITFILCLLGIGTLTACAGQATIKPTLAVKDQVAAEIKEVNSIATESTAKISTGKVMVLDFPLHDLTDLPNAPEELARITLFNAAFKQKLADDGVDLVPVTDKIIAITEAQSPTYLFDHTDVAAGLAEDSGADYIIIGVAMKPTYLFVYPRLLLVDVKTKRKAFASYVQMEGSWLEKNTTESSAKNLANKVISELNKLKTLAGQVN